MSGIIKGGSMQIIGKTGATTSSTKPLPIKLVEVTSAIEKAVEAYRSATASMRGTRSKAAFHMEEYTSHGNGKVRYTGKSASDILEDYLTKLGFKRESQMFYDLSRIVMDYAELGEFSVSEVVYWCALNEVDYEL
jgi:hypothetical protein